MLVSIKSPLRKHPPPPPPPLSFSSFTSPRISNRSHIFKSDNWSNRTFWLKIACSPRFSFINTRCRIRWSAVLLYVRMFRNLLIYLGIRKCSSGGKGNTRETKLFKIAVFEKDFDTLCTIPLSKMWLLITAEVKEFYEGDAVFCYTSNNFMRFQCFRYSSSILNIIRFCRNLILW